MSSEFNFDFDFSEFESDIKQSSRFPYCQVVSPPRLDPKELKKYLAAKGDELAFGLFIPDTEAAAAGFTPDSRWQRSAQNFTEDENDVSTGWITLNPRFHVIHMSQLEIQERTDQGWRYLGLGYEGGIETEYMDLAKGDRENYRLATRLLLLFVDENNQPLHKEWTDEDGGVMPPQPIALTARAGFGGAFATEIRDYYKNLNGVYFKAATKAGAKVKTGWLNPLASAHGVIDLELGYHHPDSKKSPYVVVVRRLAPALDKVGERKTVKRNSGVNVELVGTAFNTLFVGKTSPSGVLLNQWYSAYEKFPLPNRGYGEDEGGDKSSAKDFSAVGNFNLGSIKYDQSGDAEAVFISNGQSYLCWIPINMAEILNVDGAIAIRGTLENGTVTLNSATALEAAGVAPSFDDEPVPAPAPPPPVAQRRPGAKGAKAAGKGCFSGTPTAASVIDDDDIPF